jgi:WD40 repeat protein
MAEKQPETDLIVANERPLRNLERAIALSQGQFSLVLACCNYGNLRQVILEQLSRMGWEDDKILTVNLSKDALTLYTAVNLQELEYIPSALMVFGLETVDNIDDLLSSINQVRDEFRKSHAFPMVLWVNDQILQKMLRLAPDFASWAATPIRFEMTSSGLLEFLQEEADTLFAKILSNKTSSKDHQNNQIPENYSSVQEIWIRSYEFHHAIQELENQNIELAAELNASLHFVFGIDDYIHDNIDSAFAHFYESLLLTLHQAEPQQESRITPELLEQSLLNKYKSISSYNLLKQGVLQLYIGLCYCRLAEKNQTKSESNWQDAKTYIQISLQTFEIAERLDLVSEFIGQLADILCCLKDWSQLENVAKRSLELHQNYGNQIQLACDYGYLAQVEIEQSRWTKASNLAHTSLLKLQEAQKHGESYESLFPLLLTQVNYLILVKAQQHLDKPNIAVEYLQQATKQLPFALETSQHQYDAYRYIRLLRTLRSHYFDAGCYIEAYNIRQKRRSVEQQYGLRAFIGAGRLQPQRQATNPALMSASGTSSVALEITASGREHDVNNLIARISRADQKLIVIHGSSGVGKSSTVTAGLVPALQNRAIGDQIAVPVVLQVYKDWSRELGKSLTDTMSVHYHHKITPDAVRPNTIEGIWQQLRKNADYGLITILIFDQFEEFFFGEINRKQKQEFDRFLSGCLNISFIKIILSLREDYLHELLEFKQFLSLEAINNNILDKNIRYQLNNFSPDYAKAIINQLTERSQLHLESDLIDALVADLSAELGEVRPIELQVVGAQLQDERITTLAEYEPYRPNKLIERYIKELIKDCGPENERAAHIVLYLLTDENGTRPFKTRGELAEELAELENSSKLDLVLHIFVLSGLVVIFPDIPERYQLIHDYLVDVIRYLQPQAINLQIQVNQLREKEKNSQEEIQRLRSELNQNNHRTTKNIDTSYTSGIDFVPNAIAELIDLRKREKSIQEEIADLRAELKEKELTAQLAQSLEKQRLSEAKLNNALKILLLLFFLAILGLIIVVFRVRNSEIRTLNLLSASLFVSEKGIDALKASLKAGNELKRTYFVSPDAREETLTGLYQAVYGIQEVNRLEGHLSGVNSIAFSPDRSILVSGSADNTIKLWRIDGSLIKTLSGHQDVVNCVSFSPDSQVIVSASQDKTIKLWSRQGKLLKTLFGHTSFVNSVRFSPNGQFIASASTDKTIKLWSRQGKLLKTLVGHQDAVLDVAWSGDGKAIASASADQTIKLWSIDGKLLKTLQGHEDAVKSVAWNPDGTKIASASLDKTIKIWDRAGNLLSTLSGHNGSVTSVAFSPDGNTLASASTDNTVRLWSTSGALQETLKGHGNWVNSLAFSPDSRILASASRDKLIKFWQWDDVRSQNSKSEKSNNDWVTSISFSPDNRSLVAANRDNTVKIWNGASLVKIFKGHQDEVWGVAWSPDGHIIASGSRDKTIKLWNPDGKLIATLPGHTDTILAVAWSPNGKILASASKDKTVKLWNRDGKLIKTLTGHANAVNWVSFSPDGKLLASASDDKLVKIWDAKGNFLYNLVGHTQRVIGVTWSPNGQIIASVSNDRVKLWHRDGSLQDTLPDNGGTLISVSYSPNGKILAVSSQDKIDLWSSSGRLLLSLKGDKDELTSISFNHDQNVKNTVLAISSTNGIVFRKRADAELENLLSTGCARLHDYLQHNDKVTQRNTCDNFR